MIYNKYIYSMSNLNKIVFIMLQSYKFHVIVNFKNHLDFDAYNDAYMFTKLSLSMFWRGSNSLKLWYLKTSCWLMLANDLMLAKAQILQFLDPIQAKSLNLTKPDTIPALRVLLEPEPSSSDSIVSEQDAYFSRLFWKAKQLGTNELKKVLRCRARITSHFEKKKKVVAKGGKNRAKGYVSLIFFEECV